jgi:hypothetical protein
LGAESAVVVACKRVRHNGNQQQNADEQDACLPILHAHSGPPDNYLYKLKNVRYHPVYI